VDNKTTLFSYLYNAITTQIKIGNYKYGESLPSYRKICEIYNVGIRTVKDVLAVLKDEGYVETEERKSAVVVYRPSRRVDSKPVKDLIAKRTALLDCIEAMKIMMPDIFVRSMEANTYDDWELCKKQLKGIDEQPTRKSGV
jgi:DNA-binding transcriptional regulator YhcF (GntR family)